MQPAWHPDGRRVAWVAWDHPNMPWDGSGLYLGEAGAGTSAGEGKDPMLLAGDPGGSVAVFQPSFSPGGRFLTFITDREGWFNLWIYDLEEDSLRPLVEEPFEYAGPAWIQGLRTHAWTPAGDAVYAIRWSQGHASLVRVDRDERRPRPIGGELSSYTALGQLAMAPDEERIALLGSSPVRPQRVLTVSDRGRVSSWSDVTPEPPPESFLGHPHPLSWRVKSEIDPPQPPSCRGLFYPPRNPAYQGKGLPPAVIRIHGGPTSQALVEYRFELPFLTSRGFAVLDLNYRGSSGYGRGYRDALKGQWGVADVEDTRSAAEYLVSSGRADPDRLVVLGGSAGGFTVLLSLIRYPGLFRAGVCLYGVSDLLALARETHKFEAHYLDSMVGVLPQDEDLYRERSPLGQAGAIRDPIAIFQGEEDQVVPPGQSDRIAEALSARGVPHIYHRFPGEGHGWKQARTVETYLEALHEFLAEHVIRDAGG
jgi:dipeptidyl aminopeptidase/acylaminoacyl peptidase